MKEYQRHELSAAFPLMQTVEVKDLAKSIALHGQREAGVLYEGKILDGWHRYLACKSLRAEFYADELPEGEDPVAFVMDKNGYRRHLTASQRAASIALCLEWRGRGNDSKSAHWADYSATAAEMAEKANVSTRSVERAKVAIDAGLGDAVLNGQMSVRQAEEVAGIAKGKPRKVAKVLDEAYEKALEKIAELQEGMPELIQLAESAAAFEENEEFKAMQALRVKLRAVELTRDHLMRENTELKKEVSYWRKKAGGK